MADIDPPDRPGAPLWPDCKFAVRDAEELLKDSLLCELTMSTLCSPEVRAVCEEEMRKAAQCGYKELKEKS